ncbi:MAG: tRNA (adenosine(37)-N6)-threonylcarbamoyltransferase complex ATPase subunit type 1 TsaE [Pseudomonadota bacterium]
MNAQMVRIKNEGEMLALGGALAGSISDGLYIFLSGRLGAGKTVLARGVLRGLGHEGIVKSPTYTLVEPYLGLSTPVYHFDLYRLSTPEEIEYMGLRDYLDDASIVVVEWAERGAPLLPEPDVAISIDSVGGLGDGFLSERILQIHANTERGRHALAKLILRFSALSGQTEAQRGRSLG